MTKDPLSHFFAPAGVAVVGASREPVKLGYALARNLIQCGYTGAVHLVNPRGGELFGMVMHKSINDVPDPVDLAVLLTAAPTVPDLLTACGKRGIHAVIIASGGFRETGPEGGALETRCLEIAREFGIRFIGPNCIGLIDTHLPLDTTFLPPPGPEKGNIAFISHSGAICAAIIDWIRGQGFGLSSLVSLGNQADINETDVLASIARDPNTDVITLYMESVSNGRRFMEEARRVSTFKPILVLKVGRSESGQRAAASHTGALTGSETAFEAALRKAGVIRAETTEEMFIWARALAWCPLPKGDRVAILTNAGGPGVTAADSVEHEGLKLADFEQHTHEALKLILPTAASLHNPIDMLASASPEQYSQCLQLVLDDPGVDSVLIIIPPPPMFSAGAVAKAIIPIIQGSNKPVVAALMGEKLIQEAVEHLRAVHIPDYRFPEAAISSLGILSRRRAILTALSEEPRSAGKKPNTTYKRKVANLVKHISTGMMDVRDAFHLLSACGIPVINTDQAATAGRAVDIAVKVGYPVVMKVASPDISHKSDAGGVQLNLKDAQAVRDAFERILTLVKNAQPSARIDGVTIQPMLAGGQEVILGVVRDPQFGPLVMFGSGGTEVEGLKDLAFGLAPLSRHEAESMLESTWAGRKLRGFRNLQPADRDAVIDTLIRLARLTYDYPEIEEIEINPLLALPQGKGVVAVDVRAKINKTISFEG